MGIDLGNSIGQIIGSGAGMIGGAITGFKGTPDQYTYQDVETKNTLGNKSGKQREMEQQSYQEYLKQKQLVDMQQQMAAETDPLRRAAMEQQFAIISGEAFGGPNAQETQQINQLRDAMIGQGQGNIQNFLDENMRKTVSGAAGRGLRGQALGELQGRVIEAGNEQYGNLVGQANLQAAQNAINLPQQRMQMQNQVSQGGLNYAQLLQQQAVQNRMQTQNPYLLQQLINERLNSGTTSQNVTNKTPGTKGSFWGGITGGFGGMAAGAGAGQQMQAAFAQKPAQPQTNFQNGVASGNYSGGSATGAYGGYGGGMSGMNLDTGYGGTTIG